LELDSLQRVRAGRIDPSNQQFTNTIHTGPSTPVTRVQLAKRDPVAGTDIVCVSGSVTGAKCSIAVVGHDGMATGAGGTTSGLTVGVRTGVQIAQPGDSGAPVYQLNGSTGATINGLLVGASYDEISFHLVSTVEAQLGVAVAL